MSSGEGRKVTIQDIELAQNLIEQCLQLYMTREEAVNYLSVHAKIEHRFTELVWQKLEEQNKEFFKAYGIRLMLKDQITLFNKYLEKQVDLMSRLQMGPFQLMHNASATAGPSSVPTCYQPHDSSHYTMQYNMHQALNPTSPLPGCPPMYGTIHADTLASPKMLQNTGNSNMGMRQAQDQVAIYPEPTYSEGSSPLDFVSNATRMFPGIGDAFGATSSSINSDSEPLNKLGNQAGDSSAPTRKPDGSPNKMKMIVGTDFEIVSSDGNNMMDMPSTIADAFLATPSSTLCISDPLKEHGSFKVDDTSAPVGNVDVVHSMMPPPNANMLTVQGANQVATTSEPGSSMQSNPPVGLDSNLTEMQPTTEDVSLATSNSMTSNFEPKDDALTNADFSFPRLWEQDSGFSFADLSD